MGGWVVGESYNTILSDFMQRSHFNPTLLAHIIQRLLIQCFLNYSPLREKSIHIFLELLVVISLQQVHQFMSHDIGKALRSFLRKL